ncbi:hypothetical protein ACFWBS_59065 [Streptomyces mirabilis]|uniref:hypothetical protein n=1 Tax=Streptomyces mirabilis TaxID=68239 RepID=UPI003652962E
MSHSPGRGADRGGHDPGRGDSGPLSGYATLAAVDAPADFAALGRQIEAAFA